MVRRGKEGTAAKFLAWPPGSSVILSGDGEHKEGDLAGRGEQAPSSAWVTFTLCSSSRQLGTRIRSSGQRAKLEVETQE